MKVGYFNYLISHTHKLWNVKMLRILGFLFVLPHTLERDTYCIHQHTFRSLPK